MLITTAFDFPGYETLAVQGEIFGITVRARNIGAGCMAGLRSIIGGEIPEFTKLLAQSRNEAMARMVAEATRRGSNAIVGMRFDSGAIGQWSEICAYGTGVWISPITDVARQQYDALVATGQLPHQDTYELRVSEWTRTETIPGQPLR
ncbi:MAG: YbjQ family protein [Microthrixaceae bacterium]